MAALLSSLPAKEGFFDWIVSFSDFQDQFERLTDDVVADLESGVPLKVLIIGGGTSTLGEEIYAFMAGRSIVAEVISIDNDNDCVLHMKKSFPNSSVQYICYDFIEDAIPAICNPRERNEEYNPSTNISELNAMHNSFHIIIDKGTFDAIHVEGSVTTFLLQISRFLKSNFGRYMIISIYNAEILKQLFTIPLLQLDFMTMSSMKGSDHQPHLLVFKKKKITQNNASIFDNPNIYTLIKRVEDEILDTHYKEDEPWLTKEVESEITVGFKSLLSNGKNNLPYEQVHRLVFDRAELELLDYNFDLFLEDIATFSEVHPLQEEGQLTLEELLMFIRQMQ